MDALRPAALFSLGAVGRRRATGEIARQSRRPSRSWSTDTNSTGNPDRYDRHRSVVEPRVDWNEPGSLSRSESLRSAAGERTKEHLTWSKRVGLCGLEPLTSALSERLGLFGSSVRAEYRRPGASRSLAWSCTPSHCFWGW